jgi:hypothetical protein
VVGGGRRAESAGVVRVESFDAGLGALNVREICVERPTKLRNPIAVMR